MLVDLICPVCLHRAGGVTFDKTARGACPACNVALKIDVNIVPVAGFPEPPPRQLALRVERPRRSKVKMRQGGDRLVTSQRSWLLFLFMKRVELGPEGCTVRTWRKRGETLMLSELRGFVMLQRCLDRDVTMSPIHLDTTTSPIHLMWVSHLVWRGPSGVDLYGPLFAHGRYDDGAYYCSLLNAHLATLRRSSDPYRQLPAPA
jgi:hypothetical protein